MAQRIADVMTKDPVAISERASALEAAQAMRQSDIGDVVVIDDAEQVCGIVTDRDIAVRLVAEERDPSGTTLGDICSKNVATLSPTDSIGDAVRLMSDKAVRRARPSSKTVSPSGSCRSATLRSGRIPTPLWPT